MCDLETSRIGAPYIYDISNLRVKIKKTMFKLNTSTSDKYKSGALCTELSDILMEEQKKYIGKTYLQFSVHKTCWFFKVKFQQCSERWKHRFTKSMAAAEGDYIKGDRNYRFVNNLYSFFMETYYKVVTLCMSILYLKNGPVQESHFI
jgi:hypothetical protein